MKTKSISFPVIDETQVIVLYKKGSRGEIMGVYDSVKDIVELERLFHAKFTNCQVYKCLIGSQKSFASFNHQCRVVPKIQKRNERKEVAA